MFVFCLVGAVRLGFCVLTWLFMIALLGCAILVGLGCALCVTFRCCLVGFDWLFGCYWFFGCFMFVIVLLHNVLVVLKLLIVLLICLICVCLRLVCLWLISCLFAVILLRLCVFCWANDHLVGLFCLVDMAVWLSFPCCLVIVVCCLFVFCLGMLHVVLRWVVFVVVCWVGW